MTTGKKPDLTYTQGQHHDKGIVVGSGIGSLSFGIPPPPPRMRKHSFFAVLS